MKRILFTVGLPVVALMVFIQTGCQPAGEPANNTPASAPRETPPDTAAITAELTRIENDWPRVMKEHDTEAVRKVEADDIVSVPPDGSLTTKEQDLKDIEAGNLSADTWQVAELKVTVLDANAAVASGRSVIKGGKYKTSDGKSMDISGEYRFVDTFARRDGAWKLVASAAVKVMNPTPAASPAAKASPTPKASPAITTASPAAKASPAIAKPSPAVAKPSPAVRPKPAVSPVAKTTP